MCNAHTDRILGLHTCPNANSIHLSRPILRREIKCVKFKDIFNQNSLFCYHLLLASKSFKREFDKLLTTFLHRCFYSTLTNRSAWFYIVRLELIILYNINLFPYQVKLFLCLKNWSDVCYKAWLIYSANTHRVITCCLCSSDIPHLCEGTLTQQWFQSRRFCIAYKILHSILHHSVLSHTFYFSYDCFFL